MTDPAAAATATGADRSRRALLDSHVLGARWFGGKGRGGEIIRWLPLPWLPLPTVADPSGGPLRGLRSELVEVRYPGDGGSEWYQLLLSYRDRDDHDPTRWLGDLDDPDLGPVSVHDATADPVALGQLPQFLTGGIEVADPRGTISTDAAGALPPDLVPRRFGGEQSNTSILYSEVAILKLFRRLEQGRNLDIEVHRALADTSSTAVAAYHASATARWRLPDGAERVADLAILTEQFAGARDGWAEAVAAGAAGRDFTGPARALGAALAEVHGLLAVRFPTTVLSGDLLGASMRQRLDAAIVEAWPLDPHGPGLRRRFEALAGAEWPAQRIHGDFHLGQTLLTEDGWKIIDFEGEPMKSLAERARPDSVWRDVAGMLRSFDYVGGQVLLRRHAAGSRGDAGGKDPVTDWVRSCREAFLAGYSPHLDESAYAALRAYEADKAVYEVLYETRNRPDWVEIPMAAVATLATSEES